ncbi:MAG TPA: A24 family peptidase [Methylococcaceae bacterium]|nr:A24 family peptidase [Methylococcaceae bacterium]
MNSIEILQGNPSLFIITTTLFGLIVGSFLNVVIHRLPRMLESAWRQECEAFLEMVPSAREQPVFNLIVPRSRCLQCGHAIRVHENIPIISYLLLRGQCANCKAPISPRYPLIEALTALVSALVVWKLGPTWQAALALPLSWSLICLSAIDLDRQLLPDAITLPFLWLGLFLSLFNVFTDSTSSILGAIAGYLSLWLVYQTFRILTGKEGMGHGDFKLLGLFGAWLGWQMLPIIVLFSSLVGAVVGILMILLFRHDRTMPIPFGPYLATAGWIALLWGDEVTGFYLRVAGFD